MKRFLSSLIFLCLFMLFVFPIYSNASTREKASANTVTIYLHRENELLIRGAVAEYERNQKYIDDETDYPEIHWNLVDKSELSEEQFQTLLWKELSAGGGPDLLLTGPGGFTDSKTLLESGYLYNLSSYRTLYQMNDWVETEQYLPGVLEVGQSDGIQYLLPLTVELPILFGKTETLEAAGLKGDWPNFQSFIDDLVQAQEKSGKAAFAESSTLDWLSIYGLCEKGQLSETLSYVKTDSGETYLQPSQAFTEDSCLLSGCGKESFFQMVQNLLHLDPYAYHFFLVPDQDGKILTQVSCAAGVNKNSQNPEVALAALAGIQESYSHNWGAEDLSPRIEDGGWDSLISNASLATEFSYDWDFSSDLENSFLSSELEDWLYAQAETSITGSSFKKPEALFQTSSAGTFPKEKPVLTVLYSDSGRGREIPLTEWLTEASENFLDKDFYVQPVSFFFDGIFGLTEIFTELNDYEAGTDLLVAKTDLHYIDSSFCPDTYSVSQEIEDRKEELDSLFSIPYDTVRWKGKTAGIPVGTKSYGLWYNRSLLKQLGLDEASLKQSLNTWRPFVLKACEAGREAGIEAPALAFINNYVDVIGITSCLTEEELFRWNQEEWQTNRKAWEKAVLGMYSLIQETGMEKASRQDALYSLLEGNALFAFGGSDLEVLFSDLPEEEKQSLGYLSLTPYVTGYAVFLSENSKNPEAAFDFILEALQSESYEESIRKQGLEPVTGEEKRKVVFLPIQSVESRLSEFWKMFFEKETDPEELAEEYELYPWAESSE